MSLRVESHRRDEWQDKRYRVHDVWCYGKIVATVTVYDDGKITLEFDNEIVYELPDVEELISLAKTLPSK